MLIILAIIFAIVMCVIINLKLSDKFAAIADKKGFRGEDYFWWCFWLPIAGWAMVIALPDRGQNKNIQE